MLDPNRKLNIVVVGAHVDDHWYMGGTMLKAAKKGHKVTVIQGVSTYCSWPVVHGREAEIKPYVDRITAQTGIHVVTLGHDYLRLVNDPALIGQMAKHLADLQPDLLFCPWETDNNQDHVAIGAAARIAGIHGACFLPPQNPYKVPRQILHYVLDEQARGFVPDAYIDTGDVAHDMLQLNNVWDEIYAKHPTWVKNALHRMTVTDHLQGDRSLPLNFESEFIFGRSLVHGLQCGVRYAEAFVTYKHAPAHENLLALI